MGETAIDEATFQEFLDEMREHYTVDKVSITDFYEGCSCLTNAKYHLLGPLKYHMTHPKLLTYPADFNCNSFTNDCVGLLTGGSIPAWIKGPQYRLFIFELELTVSPDLPSDFLSTPFGAALRPTIDAMFRRPLPGAAPTAPIIQPQAAAAAAAASPDPALASTLLQAVANQAFSAQSATSAANALQTPRTSTPSTAATAGSIHICTNQASFHNVLKTHRAVISFFTSQTCPPCRMIEPVFERIAHERTEAAGIGGGGGIAFVKVDLGTGMANMLAGEYGVRATPTFIFFRDGTKVSG